MKIGILSMQRVINYGSFLQAYALKSILQKMGHKCEFIDIKPGKQINPFPPREGKLEYIINRMNYSSVKKLPLFIFVKKKERLFKKVLFPMLGCAPIPNYSEDYDAVVIGSDEVFNCTQKSKWGFTEQLFGNINCSTIISYAGSFGYTTIDKIRQYNLENAISKSMKNMKAISVRDDNSSYIVRQLCGVEPYKHLDPTLVYDFSNVMPESVKYENYILVYAYNNRIYEKAIINQVKRIAREENKKILSVGFYQEWCDENILVMPFELLAYFKNADYVVTDTFHGTVFSIKMNRPFVSIIRNKKNVSEHTNREKLFDLLCRFKLEDHALNDPERIYDILNSPIDYVSVNRFLEKEKDRMYFYLKNNLPY